MYNVYYGQCFLLQRLEFIFQCKVFKIQIVLCFAQFLKNV